MISFLRRHARWNPHLRVLPDRDMRARVRTGLNRTCDVSDWRWGPLVQILSELRAPVMVHRKGWEFGMCIWGLEKLGCVQPDAVALSVGAGHELPLFYYANRIQRMVATDLYAGGLDGDPGMLTAPERFSPFAFRRDHLEVLPMNGCSLGFDDGTFDFVFCLSAIEHFGSRERVVQSMREMARVVKRGGVICITTEYILNRATHPEFFTHDEICEYLIDAPKLVLIEPEIDLSISRTLLRYPIDLFIEKDLNVSPHIVLHHAGAIFTSLILFLRRP